MDFQTKLPLAAVSYIQLWCLALHITSEGNNKLQAADEAEAEVRTISGAHDCMLLAQLVHLALPFCTLPLLDTLAMPISC